MLSRLGACLTLLWATHALGASAFSPESQRARQAVQALLEETEDQGDGYLYKGKRITLLRQRGQALIRFQAGIDGRLDPGAVRLLGRRLEDAEAGRFFTAKIRPIGAGANPVHLLELQPKESGSTAGDLPAAGQVLDSLLARLASDPLLRYARPVYLDASTGRPVVAADRLLIRLAAGIRGKPAPAGTAGPQGRRSLLPADSSYRALLLRAEATSNAHVTEYLGDGTWILEADGAGGDLLAAAGRIAALHGILWAEPDFSFPLALHFTPDDPFFTLQQHLANTGQNFGTAGADVSARQAWDYTLGDTSTTIAVIDNGVETAHPDLRIKPGGRNFFPNTPTTNPNPTALDEDHGTAVAGVAAARGNNALGVSGMAPRAQVLPLKIAQGNSWATNSNIAKAIRYAVDTGGADVINNSWGGGTPSNALTDAIVHASVNGRGGKGTPVIFSAGNSASDYQSRFFPLWEFSPPLAAGRYRLGFRYAKNGSGTAGEDLASIDNFAVRGPDGYTVVERETFAGGIPAGWTVAPGASNWTSTTAMGYGGTGDGASLRSPAGLGNSQAAEIRTPLRTWDPAEAIQFSLKVSSQAGGDLFTLRVYDSSGNLLAQSAAESGVPLGREDSLTYPAYADSAVAVGASTEMDFRSGYSQYRVNGSGKTVAFVAPSNGGWNGVATTDRAGTAGMSQTDYTIGFGGTSSSAPLASGVAALVLSRRPDLTRNQLLDVLKASCDKIGGVTYTDGVHREYGYGRLNARKAMQLLDRPPVLAPIGNKSGDEGQPLSIGLSASDPDGDAAAFSGLDLPSGASVNGSTFSWTPTFNQTGNYNVRLIATTHTLSDTESIVLTIGNVNGPPDIAPLSDTVILETQALSFSVTATEPDGEPVTWTWEGGPPGSSFQNNSFAWTPTYSQAGSYAVRFIATSGSLSDTERVNITVLNRDRLPVISAPAQVSALEAHWIDFTVSATDADGDPILIVTLAVPQGAGFDGSRFLWLPGYDQAGVHTVRFYAIANGEADSADVAITVADAGSGSGSLRLQGAPGAQYYVMPAGDGPGTLIGWDTTLFTAGVGTYWFTAKSVGRRPVTFAERVRSDTVLDVPVVLKPHIPWLAGSLANLIKDGAPLTGLDSGAAVVDLDYDGKRDLVAAGPSGPRFLRNIAATDEAEGLYASAGGFNFPSAAFAGLHAFIADDWDGDGYYDFIVARKDGRVLRASLSPLGPSDTVLTFGDTATLAERPGKACHPRAADRDKDGLRDLWLLCAEDGLWVYRNTGSPSAPALAAAPEEIKAQDGTSLLGLSSPLWIDLDADGTEDLLAFRNGRLTSYAARWGAANALAFGPPKAFNVAGSKYDCAACKLAWRPGADGMAYLLSFAPGRPAQAHRTRLLGDLSGDGKVDAADRILLLEAWERRDTDPGWNPALNLALDPERFERIDIRDLGVFGDGWGLEE